MTHWRVPNPYDGNHWYTVCLCVTAPETNCDSCVVCIWVSRTEQWAAYSWVWSGLSWSTPSLCASCIFVWPESLVLMISPAAFVHLSQTKLARVNWLLPTRAMCNTHQAQRDNSQCQRLRFINETMHADNNIQIIFWAEEVFTFHGCFPLWNIAA